MVVRGVQVALQLRKRAVTGNALYERQVAAREFDQPRGRGVPAAVCGASVVLTSSANPKELASCIKLGANECITKPHAYDGYLEVVQRLRRYLPQSGGHSQADSKPENPIGDPPSSFFHKHKPETSLSS
jgi:hypothetical protein